MAKFFMKCKRTLSGKAVNLDSRQMHLVATLIAEVARARTPPPTPCENYWLELYSWFTKGEFDSEQNDDGDTGFDVSWFPKGDQKTMVEVWNKSNIDDHIRLHFHRFAEDNAEDATEVKWKATGKHSNHPVTRAANAIEDLLKQTV